MKKIIKNRVFQICLVLVAIVLLILLCLFNKYDENVITRAKKVLWAKYYNVECINEKCKYVVAYKGDKKGKSTIKIINSNGRTIGKYKDNYFKKKDNMFYKPFDATKNYIVLGLTKKDDSSAYGYKVISSNGKEIYKTTNTISVITNNYFYEKENDSYTIFDYKGNELYKNIKELNFYNDKKIISFKNNDELTIIDKKSNRILNGYSIKEEIKENDKTLYLIVESNDGGYYYFDINSNRIIGDSFNNYVVLSNKKLIVNKKANNELKKELISIDGNKIKDLFSNKDLLKELNLDNDSDYSIVDDTLISSNQKGVLVKNKNDNSLGTYEISSKTYNKLFDFKDLLLAAYEDSILTVYNLYSDENNTYLQVGCSLNYCDEENVIIYNPMNNEVVFKTNNEKEIKKYRQYSKGYKVVTYTDNTYSLFNEKNEEVLTSTNNIVVIDQKVVIDDDASKSNVILYSSKKNKALNHDDNLAILDTESNYNIYKFYTDNYLYLYKNNGSFIKKVSIESSNITLSDKYILYLGRNKANIISLNKNREVSYKIDDKETVENIDGIVNPPYKGSLIITNNESKEIRVLNYSGKQIKKIKNSTVKRVSFDKDNNSIFVITKQDKNYTLYIIK